MNENSKRFNNWEGEAFEKMLFEYLDSGYLENIVTFFEHEPTQLSLIPMMLSDERLRLKLGAIAILEELKERKPASLKTIVPSLIGLLDSPDKNIRGNAVYALEIIGDISAKPALLEALHKEQDAEVRDFIEDAIRSLP